MIKNKLIVVTGGAGFIGSHIAWELSKDNDVVVIDNLQTGSRENAPPAARFVKTDVRDEGIERLVKEADYVFHEAAVVSVVESFKDPIGTEDVNVSGTLRILKAMLEGSGKLVFASSAAVYGDNPNLPLKETERPRPLSPYGVTKVAVEHYLRVYNEIYGLPTVSLRYFNVFGPRQGFNQYAGVISIFINHALEGDPLVIYGDGLQTRDFIYVKDVVKANLLVAESRRANGRTFNVGRGESVSVIKLANVIKELTGSTSNIVFDKPRPGDIRHSLADIRELRSLGFEPEWDLRRGLERTIEWYSKRGSKNEGSGGRRRSSKG